MAGKEAELEIHADSISAGHNDVGWQSDLQSPADRLSAMYKLSKLTDLTITFPGHHNTLKVHRLVLAMSSPVFECMLFGPMAEGEELELPEDPPKAFKCLIQYIYCGTTNLPSVNIAVHLYHMASKYQMKALSTICSMYLQANVNGTNLPLIYDTASLLEDAALQNACSEIITSSAEAVLSSTCIGQLSRGSLKHLLQQELNVKSEISVFKGLVQWGETQRNQTAEQSEEQKSVRQVIEELLPYVRFLTMTTGEFIEHVMPSNILTQEECSSILMNMKKVQNVPLSEGFSREVKSRTAFEWANIHNVKLYDYFAPLYSETSMAARRLLCSRMMGYTSYSVARQELITDMKVSKEIYLGRIILSNPNFASHDWEVEVTDTSNTVVRMSRKYGNQNASNLKEVNMQIFATIDPPVLMTPDRKYIIWLIGIQQQSIQQDINIRYLKTNVTGHVHKQVGIDIHFWYFDD